MRFRDDAKPHRNLNNDYACNLASASPQSNGPSPEDLPTDYYLKSTQGAFQAVCEPNLRESSAPTAPPPYVEPPPPYYDEEAPPNL